MEIDVNNYSIKTIKHLLNNSIQETHFDYIKQIIDKNVKDCNLLYTQVCYLIKLFLLHDFENNNHKYNDYKFDELFIRNCFKLIKTGQINLNNNDITDNEDKDNSDKILNQFETIIDTLSVFRKQINMLQQQLRNLKKSVKKEVKCLKKAAVKNKNKGNRKPSGFANPTKVSKELCEFMNKKEGSEIARTEVTKAIISYIKTNNLQNKTNKKIISPDEKLKFLLGISEEEELTYFNLQKYMNKHFVKNVEPN